MTILVVSAYQTVLKKARSGPTTGAPAYGELTHISTRRAAETGIRIGVAHQPVCAFLWVPHAPLQEKTSPLTRRIVPSKFHLSPASRPDTRNCLNSLPPESPPPLRRLSIRPVAQTDGSFGQTSLQGPETSGNVLNRSLRCFLPRAAFDPGEGAYRPGDRPDTNTCL